MRNRYNLVREIWCEIVTFWCEIVTLASGERCNVSNQKIQLLKIWEVLQLKFELTVNGLGKLSNGKNSYDFQQVCRYASLQVGTDKRQ